MRLALVLFALVLFAGCVTPGDLREVSDLVVAFGEDLEDESKSLEEVKASAIETAERIEDVGERALERTEDALSLGEGAGLAGLLSTIAVALLNAHRNRTRERRFLADRREHPRGTPDRRRAGYVPPDPWAAP